MNINLTHHNNNLFDFQGQDNNTTYFRLTILLLKLNITTTHNSHTFQYSSMYCTDAEQDYAQQFDEPNNV